LITPTVITLGIFSFIFTILALVSPRSRMMFAMLGFTLCFVTAASITIVEEPYIFYDQADNTLVSGVSYFTGTASMSYLFFGLGLFNFAIAIILMLEFITGKELTEGEIGD